MHFCFVPETHSFILIVWEDGRGWVQGKISRLYRANELGEQRVIVNEVPVIWNPFI